MEYKYPRLYIKSSTQKKVARLARKLGKSQKSLGDKIARAGIEALGL